MEFEEKTLSRKEIYQGPIFKLVQDQVELPEGKGTAQRDLIFHNGAVCVFSYFQLSSWNFVRDSLDSFAVLLDQDEFLLIRYG